MDFLSNLQWREPAWLWLALQPVMLIMLFRIQQRFRNNKIIDTQLLPWIVLPGINRHPGQAGRLILNFLAWLAFAISMAGPRVAEKIYNSDLSQYADVIIVFDVSHSMTARDTSPSRMERARLEIYDLLERSQKMRFAIVIYAASAHILSPFTADKQVLRHYLSTINSPLLPEEGSNLKTALEYSLRELGKTEKPDAMLVISDGESHHPHASDYNNIIQKMKNDNISLYSLAVGSESGSPLIDSQQGWLSYMGESVVSKANHQLLRTLANQTNGIYSKITNDDSDWKRLYDSGLANLAIAKQFAQNSNEIVKWHELYPWTLFIGILLFMLSYYRVSVNPAHFNMVILFIICIYFSPHQAEAADAYNEAYHAYHEKKYQQAASLFVKAEGFAARIGEGNSHYRLKNYRKSSSLFIQATIQARTDKQRAHALFNLANSYYQMGNYQRAIDIYSDVIRYQPELTQALSNQALARKLLTQKNIHDDITAKRGSNGPVSSRTDNNTDTSNGRLSLDSEDNHKNISTGGNILSTPEAVRNLTTTRLVDQSIDKQDNDSSWTYQVNSIEQINSLDNNFSNNESLFWQRLFEWEEGYVSPLETPRRVPGVKPW